jgi:hypothetical protein
MFLLLRSTTTTILLCKIAIPQVYDNIFAVTFPDVKTIRLYLIQNRKIRWKQTYSVSSIGKPFSISYNSDHYAVTTTTILLCKIAIPQILIVFLSFGIGILYAKCKFTGSPAIAISELRFYS